MRIGNWYKFLALMLFSIGLLAACGGGGGGGGEPVASATITGEVLGTAFVAVDSSTGAEVGRATASGTPRTFSLQVPVGRDYMFFLLENEGTSFERAFPVYMDSDNVFSVREPQTIDMGFMSTASGLARPSITRADMIGRGMEPIGQNTSMGPFTGIGFTDANMEGAWNVHGMEDDGHWSHASLTINNGSGSFSNFASQEGDGTPPDLPLDMNPGGVITSPADPDLNGFMGRMGQMMVMTDGFTGEHGLMTALKSAPGTFASGDLTGTWQVHGIVNGPSFKGWIQGTINFDTGSVNLARNDDQAFTGPSGTAGINADGTVTFSGTSTFNGSMSSDKNKIAATMTDAPGNGVLMMLQRRQMMMHQTGDLAGSWFMHGMRTGAENAPQFGPVSVGTGGQTGMHRFQQGMPLFEDMNFNMGLDQQGMMGPGNMTGFPGMMNSAGFIGPDNDVFVMTVTSSADTVANHDLMILQK